MNRQDISKNYDVSDSGRIKSPGKFEGEMLYIPYFYDISLNGFFNPNRNEIFSIPIEKEDREQFPEIPKHKRRIRFYERDDGFVCEI